MKLSVGLPVELLYGGKEGTFQFNQAVSLSSRTADGVVRPTPRSCFVFFAQIIRCECAALENVVLSDRFHIALVLQEFAISTIKKDDRVEPNAKVSYKTPEYSVLASFTASGKV